MSVPSLRASHLPRLTAVQIDGVPLPLGSEEAAEAVDAVFRRRAGASVTLTLEADGGRCEVAWLPSSERLRIRGPRSAWDRVLAARAVGPDGARHHVERALATLREQQTAQGLAEDESLDDAVASWRAVPPPGSSPGKRVTTGIAVLVPTGMASALTGAWLRADGLLWTGIAVATLFPAVHLAVASWRRRNGKAIEARRLAAEDALRAAFARNRVLAADGPLDEDEITRCLTLARARRRIARAEASLTAALRALASPEHPAGWPLVSPAGESRQIASDG